MTTETDQQIWQRVLAGESAEFALLWRRHRDRIFRHHIHCGAAAQEAEDLTAATFLELWRRRAAVRIVDGSLLPWLIVTAQNVSRNAARARRRYERFLAALPQPGVQQDGSAGTSGADDERVAAVRDIMATASQKDRQLLALTALEGLTVREAAEALGLGESAAKMRLARLRNRIKLEVATRPLAEGGA